MCDSHTFGNQRSPDISTVTHERKMEVMNSARDAQESTAHFLNAGFTGGRDAFMLIADSRGISHHQNWEAKKFWVVGTDPVTGCEAQHLIISYPCAS